MAAAITTLNSLNDLKEALQLQDVALAYRANPTLTTASHLLKVMKLQPDEDSVWPFGNSVLWQLNPLAMRGDRDIRRDDVVQGFSLSRVLTANTASRPVKSDQ